MNHHTDINNNIDNIDIIMVYGIDNDDARAYEKKNSAKEFSKTEAIKEESFPQPISDSSMKFIRNTGMNGSKKIHQKTRTRQRQSKENNPVLQYLSQTRIVIGREPFKGLAIACMAGLLVRARLFR